MYMGINGCKGYSLIMYIPANSELIGSIPPYQLKGISLQPSVPNTKINLDTICGMKYT